MASRFAASVGAVVALALAVGSAVAAAPEGPRLAFVRFHTSPLRLEVGTVDETGALPLRLAGGGLHGGPLPLPFDAPSWSSDGSLLAFSAFVRLPTGRHQAQSSIFVVGADGSGLREVAGTGGGVGPVLAPDGHTMAFARRRERRRPNAHGGETEVFSSTSVWLVNINGGSARQITGWRNRLDNAPTSFSPDGSTLALARQKGRHADSELVAYRMDGSGTTVLSRNATDGVYSPDGSAIAFLGGLRDRVYRHRSKGEASVEVETTSDLYRMNSDGSGVRRLLKTPNTEVWPSWDPSGQRLAYVQFAGPGSEAAFFGFGDAIMEINADGTCRTKVLSEKSTAYFGPAWQPGLGREAGGIACAAG
ncbi:MAG: hypothetical protein WBM00_10630 [Solirubrobacterales bacterium]